MVEPINGSAHKSGIVQSTDGRGGQPDVKVGRVLLHIFLFFSFYVKKPVLPSTLVAV